MSTATTTAAAPPRKVPPPCWTDDESQALISIFKTRWTSLNRSNLKSHDWDDVAASLSFLFPHVTPSKTAVQCHNKIHKLRKRFRSSSSSFSRSSTWPLYPFLLDLETPPPHPNADVTDRRRVDPVTSSLRQPQHERSESGGGDEVAASIRELGEKYVEAERRKMEMEREVVMMQMEMELRQTRMVVESQRQMVDACLDALLNKSSTKKKRKVDVVTIDS